MKIVKSIDHIQIQIDAQVSKLQKIQSLKKSLMQDLLTGKVRVSVNWMANDEFEKVELPALEQLQELGWEYLEGAKSSPDASDERSSYKEVVLECLTDAIKRINPWINDENLRKVVRDLTKTQYPNLVEANQAIWTQINQCVSVTQDL